MKNWLLFLTFFLLLGLSLSVYSVGLDPSLIMYLPLDENSGAIAKDLSPFKNNAEFKGKPTWVAGKYNSGVLISTGNWLEVKDADSLDLTTALTINCWVQIKGLTGDHQSAVEKGAAWGPGEYNLLPVYSGNVLLQMNDLPEECDDEAIGGKVDDGEWHHIAGTWDGKTIKTYIDGKESSSLPCAGTLEKNNDPLFIGCRGGSSRWMNGVIDEIKIYNRALTADEIKRDMENPQANLSVTINGKLSITWGQIKSKI
ncbi:MAG: LamG domain-containing protein [Candidatus Poribacteria bacterium]